MLAGQHGRSSTAGGAGFGQRPETAERPEFARGVAVIRIVIARKVIVRSLVVAALVTGGFGMTGTAFAAPEQTGDGGDKGACPLVDTDDDTGNETTTYVPHGTKLAGLTCKDGTWVYAKTVDGPAPVDDAADGSTTTATR
jgi:hypothetical protein